MGNVIFIVNRPSYLAYFLYTNDIPSFMTIILLVTPFASLPLLLLLEKSGIWASMALNCDSKSNGFFFRLSLFCWFIINTSWSLLLLARNKYNCPLIIAHFPSNVNPYLSPKKFKKISPALIEKKVKKRWKILNTHPPGIPR